VSEAKQSLRIMARDFRRKIDVHPDLAELAAQNFIEKFLSDKKKSIAVYMTAGSEIDIYPLVEQLWARDVRVLLPCVDTDRILIFRVWNKDSALMKNKMDIFEPDKNSETVMPDIMIVPLLAFDQQGYRLGQGGGYYDATIASLRTQNAPCIYVGYAYAEQAVLLALPREVHDQRLDFVVTPQKIFDFRA
jgi:5-formyltetrahydrofolate cyclo-ligase